MATPNTPPPPTGPPPPGTPAGGPPPTAGSAPPPPGQQPGSPAPQAAPTTLANGTTSAFAGKDTPVATTCQQCKANITTEVKKSLSEMDIILIIVFLFVFFPICFVFCCCSPCSKIEHFCPQCKASLGRGR